MVYKIFGGRAILTPVLGLIAGLAMCHSANAAIIIDTFDVAQDVSLSGATPPVRFTSGNSSVFSPDDIIGGYRTMALMKTSGTSGSALSTINAVADDGYLNLSTTRNVRGKTLVKYDGTNTLSTRLGTTTDFNQPTNFMLGGGAGIDLTQGGKNTRVRFVGASDLNLPITITIYNSASQYIRYTPTTPAGNPYTIPASGDSQTDLEYDILFSDFQSFGGAQMRDVLTAAKAITFEFNETFQSDANLNYVIITEIPEPAAFLLVGGALIALGLFRRRLVS